MYTQPSTLTLKELHSLPTEYIYVFFIIPRIISDYFLNSICWLVFIMETQHVSSEEELNF
jgi:hypothetical protein